MSDERRNVFAFDRNYYINRADERKARTSGSAALAVDYAEEEFDEAYYLPEEEPSAIPVHQHEHSVRNDERPSERTVTIHHVSLNIFSVSAMILATLGVVLCACILLNTQSQVKQLSKDYRLACEELADIKAGNEVTAGGLLVANDREYIYNVAVGRLGMVYPDNNTQIAYMPAETGYVHQFSSIPE